MVRLHAQDMLPPADPLWYRDAVLYEIHVRAFFDSNGDGIGDLAGLREKLDYIQDLGVTAIWLLPFYPSPLRDDGYDIADYTSVHPSYGTLSDFRTFLREAHRRGLRVVTELVLNHTSDQHPWFQRARRAPRGSALRDYYVWSDTPEKFKDARVIFQDFEPSNWSWDPIAGAYYWHRFYAHQPDLNFGSPAVHRQLFRIVDFWLSMGVDGMRLDAIPYLYEREGTNCENLPETHAFLKALRRHADDKFPGRMFLAEANQWPEDAAAYLGDGDECHMAFHFPLMPRLFMAVRMEDRFPIVDILNQTPSIPANAQWALFLRNHDELTLEMVTDEERDYMYRVYAQDRQMRVNLGIRRRLAPLLGNDRRKIELLNGLLLSLPGTPVLYYGDEIGMGDNIYLGDRNGMRTPMQWNGDRNAGFSRASAQRLYLPIVTDPEYHFETVNVEVQQNNPSSPLWWIKRVLALRQSHRAFGRGTFQLLYPENRKVLAYVRGHDREKVLVVANLSRFAQHVELDLATDAGRVPVEMFGHTEFPAVAASPYPLTLGPHGFYWFALEHRRDAVSMGREPADEIPVIEVSDAPDGVFSASARNALQSALASFIGARRWLGAEPRRIKSLRIMEAIALSALPESPRWILARVDHVESDAETCAVALSFAAGGRAEAMRRDARQAIVAEICSAGAPALPRTFLIDAIFDPDFDRALLEAIARRRRWKGQDGDIVGTPAPAFRRLRGEGRSVAPVLDRPERISSSVVYGDRFVGRLVRRTEPGVHPDAEISEFLTDRAGFAHAAPLAGALQYRASQGEPTTLALLHGFVPNHGDAWRYTLDALDRFLERMLGLHGHGQPPTAPAAAALGPRLIGSYWQSALLLGTRTAQLHLALASGQGASFAPEPFSMLSQRSLYQSLHTLAERSLPLLRRQLDGLPSGIRPAADALLVREEDLRSRWRFLLEEKMAAQRIRVHGSYDLSRVLFTGKDFVVIDFGGDPCRELSSRRRKRSALVDVAAMMSSLRRAAAAALSGKGETATIRAQDRDALRPWARLWTRLVSDAFLQSYLATAREGSFLPADRTQLARLLDLYLLERAIYEIGYALRNRPESMAGALDEVLGVLAPAAVSEEERQG